MNNEHRILAENSKGFLGVASDFVENEERFCDLRDSLLGNVVIVDQLINANEIAKVLRYQYKIVTLDGDIVNRGGSMTGGQGKNNTTPLTIQKELTSLLQSLDGQLLKVEGLQSQLSSLQARKDRVSSDIVQLQISLAI